MFGVDSWTEGKLEPGGLDDAAGVADPLNQRGILVRIIKFDCERYLSGGSKVEQHEDFARLFASL